MSKHLFGQIITHHGTAANNRGENEGNITTLQKLMWNGEVHTTVSAEAIRFAIRWFWQSTKGEAILNRRWKEEGDKPSHHWADHTFATWENYLDDDVLGFMAAVAAKKESKEAGSATIRRARLEISRAVSLTPFDGDITFNAASIGATPSASKTGKDPVPYGTEVHATRYQYGFALTPETLHKPERTNDVLDALTQLSEVAGNQARFLFDFSPESIVLRWTDDFAPRILYSFQCDHEQNITVPELMYKVQAGDIAADELIIGGKLAQSPEGQKLKELGASVFQGVKAAASEAKQRIASSLKLN